MKILILALLLTSLNAQAETFVTKVSAAADCAKQQDIIQFASILKTPEALNFLVGEEPTLLPLALFVDNDKFKDESFSGTNQSIAVTTAKGKFYTYSSKGEVRILLKVPRDFLCKNESEISFVYSVSDSQKRSFGNLKVTFTPDALTANTMNLVNRDDLLNSINMAYLPELTYYLSDSFPWHEESNDTSLVDFFSSVDSQYVLRERDIQSILNNPLFNVQFVEGRLRLNYGNGSFLEFTSQNTAPVIRTIQEKVVTRNPIDGSSKVEVKTSSITEPTRPSTASLYRIVLNGRNLPFTSKKR